MPRAEFYSLDGDAKLAQMMGVTPSSLMAMLKQNVDLKQFGVSAEFAETAKAVYEAVPGAQEMPEREAELELVSPVLIRI